MMGCADMLVALLDLSEPASGDERLHMHLFQWGPEMLHWDTASDSFRIVQPAPRGSGNELIC